jgi:hypothetical protein
MRREALIPGAAGEELEGGSWVHRLYVDPQGERNNRMPGKRRSGVRGEASLDPRDIAKAGLPEA